MEKRYCDLLAQVRADETFKRDLIARLDEAAQARRDSGRESMMKRSHWKKWPVLAAAALALLACTGAAMAVLHTAFGAKDSGVQFSADYPRYVQTVPGQTAGDPSVDAAAPDETPAPPRTEAERLDLQTGSDGIQVALESYLCDKGFLDLQFRVKISGEKLAAFRGAQDEDWEEPLTFLSFNDPIQDGDGGKFVRLGGANYTLNIDGQEVWLRGRTAQAIERVGEGEYVIQQMWFLDEDVLGGRDDFQISLGEIAVGLGERCIPIDGGFELTVSRAKAAAATTEVALQSNAWSPRPGVTKTVERVTQTPLQTIFRIRSVYTGVSSEYLDVDDWNYLVCDADGQPRPTYSARVSAEITYADGVKERLTDPGEYDFARSGRVGFTDATFVTEEIVAAAPVDGSVTLRAYASEYAPDYRLRAVASYQIDLSAGTVEARPRDAVLYDAGTGEMDHEFAVYYRMRYGQEAEEVLGVSEDAEELERRIAQRGEYVSELD